jgi:hypothetical protein
MKLEKVLPHSYHFHPYLSNLSSCGSLPPSLTHFLYFLKSFIISKCFFLSQEILSRFSPPFFIPTLATLELVQRSLRFKRMPKFATTVIAQSMEKRKKLENK